MPSITPSLWFDNDLEEAAEFYTSVFPNSKIESMSRFTEAARDRRARWCRGVSCWTTPDSSGCVCWLGTLREVSRYR
jgi:hypothetical protein